MEPEFRWLEARGLGELDGSPLSTASTSIRALDSIDIDNSAEPSEDGTPSDSINDVFSRLRNTVAKIEQTYGGGDFLLVAGDSTVLSILAAAACGADLREHARFELPPGEYHDLRELVSSYRAGLFRGPPERAPPSADELEEGRAALREIGPNLFSETEAGSWVLGEGVRR